MVYKSLKGSKLVSFGQLITFVRQPGFWIRNWALEVTAKKTGAEGMRYVGHSVFTLGQWSTLEAT